MHFRHYSLRIKISFKISFQCSLKLILIKKFHGTFSRVPWNFLNSIWTTPVVPWNSMELKQRKLKFHGILRNSMEFCPDPKFYGIPWNFFHTPEFHGIPWNFGIWLMITCYWDKISQKRYILHWFQYRNSYFEHPSVSENGAKSAKMACC